MASGAERLDVHREQEGVPDRVSFFLRRDIDPHGKPECGRNLDGHQRFVGTPFRKVESQPSTFTLGSAGRMQMELHHDVGVGAKRLRDAVRKKSRRHPRHPSADPTRAPAALLTPAAGAAPSTESSDAAGSQSGQHIVAADVRRVGGRRQKKERVVNNFASARLEVDGGDPLVLEQVQRQHDVAIKVRTVGGDLDVVRQGQLRIGPSKRPALRKGRRARGALEIA